MRLPRTWFSEQELCTGIHDAAAESSDKQMGRVRFYGELGLDQEERCRLTDDGNVKEIRLKLAPQIPRNLRSAECSEDCETLYC